MNHEFPSYIQARSLMIEEEEDEQRWLKNRWDGAERATSKTVLLFGVPYSSRQSCQVQ